MVLLESKTKKIHRAKITKNQTLAENVFLLEFEANIENINPGNFISILCENKTLRRPFSIAGVNEGKIQIIYKIKGDGTAYMSKLRKNDRISIIGPLGNCFNINNKKSLLIGAGVGIAPIKFLAEKLNKNNIEHKILAGMQSMIILNLATNIKIYTDDGSSDNKGSIIDNLEQDITEYNPEIIYTCGPKIVMKKAVEIAKKYNIPIETALERDFACGTGVCMGCVVEIMVNDTPINKRICKDGPIFDGRTVLWS